MVIFCPQSLWLHCRSVLWDCFHFCATTATWVGVNSTPQYDRQAIPALAVNGPSRPRLFLLPALLEGWAPSICFNSARVYLSRKLNGSLYQLYLEKKKNGSITSHGYSPKEVEIPADLLRVDKFWSDGEQCCLTLAKCSIFPVLVPHAKQLCWISLGGTPQKERYFSRE